MFLVRLVCHDARGDVRNRWRAQVRPKLGGAELEAALGQLARLHGACWRDTARLGVFRQRGAFWTAGPSCRNLASWHLPRALLTP